MNIKWYILTTHHLGSKEETIFTPEIMNQLIAQPQLPHQLPIKLSTQSIYWQVKSIAKFIKLKLHIILNKRRMSAIWHFLISVYVSYFRKYQIFNIRRFFLSFFKVCHFIFHLVRVWEPIWPNLRSTYLPRTASLLFGSQNIFKDFICF